MKKLETTNTTLLDTATTGDQSAARGAHTPGPWTLCDRQVIVVAATHHYTTMISDCAVGGNAWVQQAANARLVASAPELLAACKDCLEGRGDWMALMTAAVAKAEGR